MIAAPAAWSYRLRCDGRRGARCVGNGRSSPRRWPAPAAEEPPRNSIDTDGRTYRTGYQALIPNMTIKDTGRRATISCTSRPAAAEETFESTSRRSTPGKKLKEATFTFWLEQGGVKDRQVSTLIIEFDQKAAQVYIEAPRTARRGPRTSKCAAPRFRAGRAKIDVNELPVDSKNRFHATRAADRAQARPSRSACPTASSARISTCGAARRSKLGTCAGCSRVISISSSSWSSRTFALSDPLEDAGDRCRPALSRVGAVPRRLAARGRVAGHDRRRPRRRGQARSRSPTAWRAST